MRLQIAGNPDQQEDALDDQYQEEVEDEVTWTQTLPASYCLRSKKLCLFLADVNHENNVTK